MVAGGDEAHSVDGLAFPIELPPLGSRRRKHVLYQQLREAIVSGRLKAGAQLPPSRVIAETLRIARNTVVAIYDMLAADGYVDSRVGGGTFVCKALAAKLDLLHVASDPDGRLVDAFRTATPLKSGSTATFNLRLGHPDKALFPFGIWRQLSTRALRDLERSQPAAADPEGSIKLREATSAHVAYSRAIACGPEDCVVTSGAQQAFDLITRILVTPGRTVVAVENPGYPPLHRLLAASGAIVTPVPMDANGMLVEAIPPEARIIFVTPSNHVPLGAAMSLARRMELLELAARTGAVIVEDDYEGEFRFADRPVDALKTLDRSGSVFYVGTFTKCTMPALRLGYVVPPRWARSALVAAKQMSDWHCPWLGQETLALFIREGHLVRHTRRLRRALGERRRRFLQALVQDLPHDCLIATGSGLHVVLQAPAGVSSARLAAIALTCDVDAEPLTDYYLPGTGGREGLVLGIGLLATARADAAAQALGRAYAAAATEAAPTASGA